MAILALKVLDKDSNTICVSSGEDFVDLVCTHTYEKGILNRLSGMFRLTGSCWRPMRKIYMYIYRWMMLLGMLSYT